MPAYLDHAASTPMRPESLEVLARVSAEHVANPSGAHRLARAARQVIDDAREVVADVVGADFSEVVFTSGGTEADNLAVLGTHDRRGGTLLTSAVEHHAVLDPVVQRGGTVVGVDPLGALDLDRLADVLDPSVTLVSVMSVNNETGVVQPLAAIAALVRELAPDAALHTDAVQAAPWLDLRVVAASADLVSISGHKFGGPKGVGALVVRGNGRLFAPRAVGGGQERERRSGTPDVAGIAAMAAALEANRSRREAEGARVGALRDRLLAGLVAADAGVEVTAAAAPQRVPGIAHVCIPGVESESLLFLMEDKEVYAAAAASCASGAMEASHVLTAMGIPGRAARGALRLSLGWSSTDEDVDLALAVVPDAVARLRRHP